MQYLIDTIAKFFLVFGQEFILIPLIIIGFLALNKKTYGHTIFLLLFTMIFYTFLKSIFQIPLAEHLNKTGYAFTSGHMQSAIVFYGWLWFAHKNVLVRSITSIIILIYFHVIINSIWLSSLEIFINDCRKYNFISKCLIQYKLIIYI